jgi:hypothetical protein
MSITSKMQSARNSAQQPASNILGTMGAAALAGGGTPTTLGATMGDPGDTSGGINFMQACIGLATVWLVWWALTWVLEKLLPLKDSPHFLIDWLHGLKYALLVAGWFIVWKMTAGVAPLSDLTPYKTIAASI